MSDLNQAIQNYPELQNAIIAGYRGSIAHGMYVPPKEPTSIDDKDLMYIVVPDQEHYTGLKSYGSKGTKEIKKDEWDIVAYEARKFVSLLEQGNPNVLMMLWLKPNYYLNITDAGQMLIDNKHFFIGKHVYRSFTGYAHGQLHRMTHQAFLGHMGDKRRKLVEQFGFDTKNAAHLVRLLRMGIEFLNDGVLYVDRHDATELLEIKKGEWPLARITAEADKLFEANRQAYMNSKLPNEPDRVAISKLCSKVVQMALSR